MDLLPRLLGLPEHCKEDDEEEYSPSKNGPSVLCKHGSATQGSFKREININLLVWRCGSAGQCILVMGNTLVNTISLIPLFSYIIVVCGFGFCKEFARKSVRISLVLKLSLRCIFIL